MYNTKSLKYLNNFIPKPFRLVGSGRCGRLEWKDRKGERPKEKGEQRKRKRT